MDISQNVVITCNYCTASIIVTLWLFNIDIAMENGPFIDDCPIKNSIYKGFSMAMLNNQRVISSWMKAMVWLKSRILAVTGVVVISKISRCFGPKACQIDRKNSRWKVPNEV